MPDILSIVNTIRAQGSTEYSTRVPLATRTNIDAVGNPILNYQAVQNEFLNALVNKIAFTLVQTRVFKNPLSLLKKGTKPMGIDIENVYTNPAIAETYDKAGTTLLATKNPVVFTEYFRLNRQDQYTVTVWRKQLAHAFTSWDNLNALIDEITNSLYSGDYIDEFILMKNTFAQGIQDQKMITVGVTAITDEATARGFVKAVKTASSAMTYPSTAYNAFKKVNPSAANAVTTWSDRDRQILIIRSDVINTLDVDVLAAAFNIDKVKFMGRVLEVDSFGSMTNVLAILADESVLQVYDEVSEMTDFYNPKGMYTNYFWNHWQVYALSVLSDAIAFVDDSASPVVPVITAPAATDTTVSGTGEIGATVFVQIGLVVKKSVVDAAGAYTVGAFAAMTQGDVVTAWQVDLAGNISPDATSAVTA